MKEIKSTEFLDKQIHVEAAKKIQAILEKLGESVLVEEVLGTIQKVLVYTDRVEIMR